MVAGVVTGATAVVGATTAPATVVAEATLVDGAVGATVAGVVGAAAMSVTACSPAACDAAKSLGRSDAVARLTPANPTSATTPTAPMATRRRVSWLVTSRSRPRVAPTC